jgi:hypothetical protein
MRALAPGRLNGIDGKRLLTLLVKSRAGTSVYPWVLVLEARGMVSFKNEKWFIA